MATHLSVSEAIVQYGVAFIPVLKLLKEADQSGHPRHALLSKAEATTLAAKASCQLDISFAPMQPLAAYPLTDTQLNAFIDAGGLYGRWDGRSAFEDQDFWYKIRRFVGLYRWLAGEITQRCRESAKVMDAGLDKLCPVFTRGTVPYVGNEFQSAFLRGQRSVRGFGWTGFSLTRAEGCPGGIIATDSRGTPTTDEQQSSHVYQSEILSVGVILAQQLRETYTSRVAAIVLNITPSHARVVEGVVHDRQEPHITMTVKKVIRHDSRAAEGDPPPADDIKAWRNILQAALFLGAKLPEPDPLQVEKTRAEGKGHGADPTADDEKLRQASGSTAAQSTSSSSPPLSLSSPPSSPSPLPRRLDTD